MRRQSEMKSPAIWEQHTPPQRQRRATDPELAGRGNQSYQYHHMYNANETGRYGKYTGNGMPNEGLPRNEHGNGPFDFPTHRPRSRNDERYLIQSRQAEHTQNDHRRVGEGHYKEQQHKHDGLHANGNWEKRLSTPQTCQTERECRKEHLPYSYNQCVSPDGSRNSNRTPTSSSSHRQISGPRPGSGRFEPQQSSNFPRSHGNNFGIFPDTERTSEQVRGQILRGYRQHEQRYDQFPSEEMFVGNYTAHSYPPTGQGFSPYDMNDQHRPWTVMLGFRSLVCATRTIPIGREEWSDKSARPIPTSYTRNTSE